MDTLASNGKIGATYEIHLASSLLRTGKQSKMTLGHET